jgi:hypothetical protein
MIIIRISGCLATQMFLYAQGRQIAIRNNTELKLDLSWFQEYPDECPFDLFHYNINATVAKPEEIRRLKTPKPISMIMLKDSHLFESDVTFKPEIFGAGDDIYLEGYGASEKYFENISGLIRQEFTLAAPLSDYSKDVLLKIRLQKEPVCIHFRRGNYLTIPWVQQLTTDYYVKAIFQMLEKVPDAHFFIFSDEDIKIPDTDRVTNLSHGRESVKNYEDLYLMSQCRHHILANGAFSWWAAWLGEHPSQVVLTSNKLAVKELDTRDFSPERWTRI